MLQVLLSESRRLEVVVAVCDLPAPDQSLATWDEGVVLPAGVVATKQTLAEPSVGPIKTA